MLRARIRKLVVNKDNHPKIIKFFKFLIIISLIWIFAFPYIARNVFTSENALNGDSLQTTFGNDGLGFTIFQQVMDKVTLSSDD